MRTTYPPNSPPKRPNWPALQRTTGTRRMLWDAVVVVALAMCLGATSAQAVPLPDGRVYEQVSPNEKNGSQAVTLGAEEPNSTGYGVARADGDAVLYGGTGAIGATPTGFDPFSVSRRFSEGWHTSAVIPRPQGSIGFTLDQTSGREPSTDFSHFAFVAGGAYAHSPDASGDANIFRTGEDPFTEPQWLGRPTIENPNPPLGENNSNADLQIAGGSPDLSTVYFTYYGTLVEEDKPRAENEIFQQQTELKIANAGEKATIWGFYEWKNGALSSAGVLPNGKTSAFGAVPAAIGQGGTGFASPDEFDNQVSASGSRGFFVSPDPEFCNNDGPTEADHKACREADPPELYVRETEGEGATETRQTVLVSQDTRLPKVAELNSEGKEEEYPARALHGSIAVAGPDFQNLGSYVFASPDGSQAFFESADRLTSAAPESQFPKKYDFDVDTNSLTYLPNVTDGEGDSAPILATSQNGAKFLFEQQRHGQLPELDLWSNVQQGGLVTPITQLPSPVANSTNSNGTLTIAPARSIADGSVFVFETDSQLPQAINALGGGPANNGGGWQQIYRYVVSSGVLTCVSCPPTGIAPSGDARLSEDDSQGGSDTSAGEDELVGSRGISADGARVFFDALDPLVPQDIDGRRDVYEWEEPGVGSCSFGHSGGCIYLISSGTSPQESFFVDNSASGEDVFFATASALVPGDTDDGYDVYDARVDGGFPQTPSPAGCSGDACQGPLSVTTTDIAPGGSATFTLGVDFTPGEKSALVKSNPLTRMQKLSKALSACRVKRSTRTRARCETRAQKRYGRVAKLKSAASSSGR